MARQVIDLTTVQANGKKGESAVNAFTKINNMTQELYDATAAAYKRANILGTVSQLGGVPTGAIIERGTNANGKYVRYADGSQICFGSVNTTTVAGSTGTSAFAFAAAFAESPIVVPSAVTGFAARFNATTSSISPTAVAFGIGDNSTGNISISIMYIAIGRWF